jgi:hypothetical protein
LTSPTLVGKERKKDRYPNGAVARGMRKITAPPPLSVDVGVGVKFPGSKNRIILFSPFIAPKIDVFNTRRAGCIEKSRVVVAIN